MKTDTLSVEQLDRTNAYWRAADYLSVGQIHLYDDPLLAEGFGTFLLVTVDCGGAVIGSLDGGVTGVARSGRRVPLLVGCSVLPGRLTTAST